VVVVALDQLAFRSEPEQLSDLLIISVLETDIFTGRSHPNPSTAKLSENPLFPRPPYRLVLRGF